MKLLLKVCGNRDLQNTKEVAETLPDMMGFIFYKPSPRFAGELEMPVLPNSIKAVAVFVDEELEKVISISKKHHFSWVQLHGHESPEYCREVKKMAHVMKAFHIDGDFDFEKTKPYIPYCDYFLFDTKGKTPGGNGFRFNWELLNNYHYEIPFFLSGGIDVEHLEEVKNIRHKSLIGLDINSGVEVSAGVKDLKKLNTFITKIKTL